MSETFDRLQRSPLAAERFDKLQQTHCFIIGAGGLGSSIAITLSGCGIGKLTLVDGDTVSNANIPHSSIFTQEDVGKKKVEVVATFLSRKFQNIAVTPLPLFIMQCDQALFARCNLVVCCPDNDATRLWVNHYSVLHKKPAVYVGLGGPSQEWTGYTYIARPGAACFNCFFHAGGESGMSFATQPITGDLELDRQRCGGTNEIVPTLAPVVGLVSAYTASVVLKLLLGLDVPTYTNISLLAPFLEPLVINAHPHCIECGVKEEFSLDLLSREEKQGELHG